MSQNTETSPPIPGSPVRRRRRNMRPCFTCSMRKTRCKLVSPGLCENCQKARRTQCVDYVPWRNTRVALSSVRQAQIFAEGQASSGPSSYEANIAIPHHDHGNYNHAGLPVQQWQVPNNAIHQNTQRYAIDVPLPYDPTFVNAPSQQGSWSLMVPPNGNFNNPIFSNYAPQSVAPIVPPYMHSLGLSSFPQDNFTTIDTQWLYTRGEQSGTDESNAIQDSPGPVENARKHDGAFSTDWPPL